MVQKIKTKKTIDQKIDDLALITANGFSEVHNKLHELDLKIDKSREELKKDFNNAFESHIKTVRSDYDSLSSRVGRLETMQK